MKGCLFEQVWVVFKQLSKRGLILKKGEPHGGSGGGWHHRYVVAKKASYSDLIPFLGGRNQGLFKGGGGSSSQKGMEYSFRVKRGEQRPSVNSVFQGKDGL